MLCDLNDSSVKMFSRVRRLHICVNHSCVIKGSKVIQCTAGGGSVQPKSPFFGNNSGLCDSIFVIVVSA